jgi:hypothetical protein
MIAECSTLDSPGTDADLRLRRCRSTSAAVKVMTIFTAGPGTVRTRTRYHCTSILQLDYELAKSQGVPVLA